MINKNLILEMNTASKAYFEKDYHAWGGSGGGVGGWVYSLQ